ncbi:secretory subunit [Tilletia horrida]|uniref:Secretory subunit n=1 Tax=Tilletia horrida TaxID=155126 RepID=A0AAN6GSB8_9BASI|nr:secretory subunit [Tilletia horrida]KAK0550852.1 secretory subunit [Tilletia horrida]KAK0564962.1 secretory subunit [Tilletia horrida]
MSEYKYDEEGGQFLTFVLTFLLLILVPLTYSTLTSKRARHQSWFDVKGQKIKAIKNIRKRSITNPQVSARFLFLIGGWAAVAYLVQKIANAATNSTHAVYDPFAILNLKTTATDKEIKKHYKKLSIKFHPDKIELAANETKEWAEAKFIELTKAYKSLTDETIRKNFELYGHPDGRQEMSMGIALPTWIVQGQNNVWVLGAYAIMFGIGLPYLVARWWYGSRSRTKDGIDNATAQSFFKNLREDTPVGRLIAMIAISQEFEAPAYDKRGKLPYEEDFVVLRNELSEVLSEYDPRWWLIDDSEFKSQSIRRALTLLYAYFLRMESKNQKLNKDMYQIGQKGTQLMNGILSISLAHSWLNETLEVMQTIQSLVQAVPLVESRQVQELMQLPHLNTQRANALVNGSKLGKEGIQGFWNMPDEQRRKILAVGSGSGLSGPQYDELVKVAGEWPRIELVDAYFKVVGERLVTTGSIVQFVIKVKLAPLRTNRKIFRNGISPDNLDSNLNLDSDVRPGGEGDEDTQLDALLGRNDDKEKEGKQPIGYTRAPYYLEERKPHWWVFIGDYKLDKVIVQPTRMSDIGPDRVRTFSIQFQAPPQAALYTFQAFIVSDSYLGADASKPVKLKVDDPSALDEDVEEDDISDPDEDTLAGQMAAMRGERVKRREDDEDDDSSATDDDVAEAEEDEDSDESD